MCSFLEFYLDVQNSEYFHLQFFIIKNFASKCFDKKYHGKCLGKPIFFFVIISTMIETNDSIFYQTNDSKLKNHIFFFDKDHY